MTFEARFLKTNFGGLNLGPMGLNQAQNEVFNHFLEFGSYVFLAIEYDNSLQQRLASSRGIFSLNCIDDSVELCLIASRGKTHNLLFFLEGVGAN